MIDGTHDAKEVLCDTLQKHRRWKDFVSKRLECTDRVNIKLSNMSLRLGTVSREACSSGSILVPEKRFWQLVGFLVCSCKKRFQWFGFLVQVQFLLCRCPQNITYVKMAFANYFLARLQLRLHEHLWTEIVLHVPLFPMAQSINHNYIYNCLENFVTRLHFQTT